MATTISSTSSSPFLYAFLLLLLCYVKKEHFVEANNSPGTVPRTHTVEVSSFPVFDQGSSLRGVPNYGLSIQQNQKKGAKVPSSHSEMLLPDRLRLPSLREKLGLFKKNRGTGVSDDETEASVPVQTGTALGMGTGNYVVTLGLGTPAKKLTLLIDGSSDISWTQCEPCVTSCHQNDPRFDPAKSSSYVNVSCYSPACRLIDGLGQTNCSAGTCHYEYPYSSKYLSGFLATEYLTIAESGVLKNFLFGCGQKNQGPFGRASGVLSLSPSPLSLPSHMASTYNTTLFSYCLPSPSGSTGHLTFGGKIPEGTIFTPMVQYADPVAYPLNITGMTVGGRLVDVFPGFYQDAGAVIDPGTLISRLPPAVHGAVSSAFEALMTDYPRVDGYADFTTCYDFSGHATVTIPLVSFLFEGGLNVEVRPLGTMIRLRSMNIWCLAFVRNLEDLAEAILGSTQQITYDVVYDLANARIGFAPNGCN